MVELKLEVHDSPNSAGVIIDAVRCAKIGLDRGMAGPLEGPSAYFMKSPAQAVPRRARPTDLVEAYARRRRRPEVAARRPRGLPRPRGDRCTGSLSTPLAPPGPLREHVVEAAGRAYGARSA